MYKNDTHHRYCHPVSHWLKTGLMWFNTTLAFMIIGLLQLRAGVYAQRVTLDRKHVSIEAAMGEINQQTGYDFMWLPQNLKSDRKINLKLKEATLETAMGQLLQGLPLAYEIKGKTIVIREKTVLENMRDVILPVPGEDPGSAAKQQLITGRVLNAEGQPLAGATVSIKGTSRATITAKDGSFILRDAGDNATLVISYVGYVRKEVPASGPVGDVSLEASSSNLDEAQVIGYGTTTQRLSTGNVSVVKAEVIGKQPVTNPLQSLIGRVPGLVVTQGNGLPGAGLSVEIRGRNSIAAGNNPLYIVDGVPFPSDNGLVTLNTFSNVSPLNSISPENIESISVLKDADATAIYGSRGANGVILITTKQGKTGKSKFDLSISNGYGSVTRTATPLSTAQYVQLRKDAFANSNLTPTTSNAPDLLSWDANTDNQLQDWYMGNITQNWDASTALSGGNTQINFLISGNYHQENTVFSKNDRYRRGNLHYNLGHVSLNNKLKINFTGIYSSDYNKMQNTNTNSLLSIAMFPPNYPLYDATGSLNWVANLDNPFALATGFWKNSTDNFNTNLVAGFEIVEGLNVKSSFGYNKIDIETMRPNPTSQYNPSSNTLGRNFFNTQNRKVWVIEPQLTYNKTLSKGKLDVLLGSTIQHSSTKGHEVYISNYYNELLLESMSGGTVTSAVSNQSQYNFLSFFGRANYNWMDKYILNFTFRRDGSSRFGPGKQFGNFGSAGAAWIFSNESFIRSQLPWLSYGKLRGSYGSTGNDGIGDYGYLSIYTTLADYGTTKSIYPSQVANPDFQWEVNKKLELALDLGFLQDRILFNTAWYLNRSGNQLVIYPLPATTGFAGYTANLPALVQNTGWEFELNTENIKKANFSWSSSLNLTIPRNKLLDFPNIEATSYANTLIVGQPLNTILRYELTGIDPETGLAQFRDVDNNGTMLNRSSYNGQGGDYVNVGTTNPKWYAGLNNSISYKSFQFDVFVQYVNKKGNNLYFQQNGFSSFGRMSNFWTDFLDYWKQPGDVSTLPKPFAASNPSVINFGVSNKTFSDASFLRIKNISLSYNLPNNIIQKMGLNRLQVYGQGQNLWTVTNYIGYDPEQAGTSNVAIPPVKIFTFGLQATF